jgi:hypothetical protein
MRPRDGRSVKHREEEQTGVLVVRVWFEQRCPQIRARLIGRLDVRSGEETSVTVVGVEAATTVVRDWMGVFERQSTGGRAVTRT